MTKTSLKGLSAAFIKSVNGNISINLNNSPLMHVSMDAGNVTIDLLDKKFSKLLVSKIPKNLMKLSTLRSYSKFFNSSNISVDIRYKKQTLIKVGKGASSLMDHIDVHPIRWHEFMK
ncbi:MAG: hypothetical protein LVQ96_02375 [Thermoplasmatales archaeon]|nr:hypothetical protein [Thermoplasmatales archaeon]MCW6169996.1 hypothetical protein [Thermoplasmatales archaeon]